MFHSVVGWGTAAALLFSLEVKDMSDSRSAWSDPMERLKDRRV
jgi:hypothetical protein